MLLWISLSSLQTISSLPLYSPVLPRWLFLSMEFSSYPKDGWLSQALQYSSFLCSHCLVRLSLVLCSWPSDLKQDRLVQCPKINLMTMTEWRKCPSWDAEFSHAYSEMLNALTFCFSGAFWSWRHPLSMGLPTGTDWLLSDSKDHPSQM